MKFLGSWKFKPLDLEPESKSHQSSLRAILRTYSTASSKLSLFCIIDSTQFYKTRTREHHMYTVIMHLVDLVLNKSQKQNIQVIFKLLITSPARSVGLWKLLRHEDIWQMPSDIERSIQSFNLKNQPKEKRKEMKEVGDARGFESRSEDN